MDVRRGLAYACLVGCSALLYACEDDQGVIDLRDADLPEQDAGDAGDGGSRADAGRGMDAGDAGDASQDAGDMDAAEGSLGMDASDTLDASDDAEASEADGGDAAVETAPIVELLTPAASDDPVTGSVLTGESFAVSCSARERPGQPAIGSVTISVYDSDPIGMQPAVTLPATRGAGDVYVVPQFPLTSLASGVVRIRCTAMDVSTNNTQTVYQEISTFYDGGPTIEIISPLPNEPIARGKDTNTDMQIQFTVTPSPLTALAADDPGADIGPVTISVGERSVTYDPPVVMGNALLYTKNIDFQTFFDSAAIDEVSIEVSAKNQRPQGAVTVKKSLVAPVDGLGPVITVLSPTSVGEQSPIVGGRVTVQARISDVLAGITEGDDRLYAVIMEGSTARHYPLALGNSEDVYGFYFDAPSFDASVLEIQLHALDDVGNESVNTITVRLDTVPPWISLDPPSVRTYAYLSAACSSPFDPTGNTPIDGEVIAEFARFRAVVWERGIQREGQDETWLSGVNNGTVEFFGQFHGDAMSVATDRPLIIDTTGDGVCDAINNRPITSGQLIPYRVPFGAVSTGGVPPSGAPPYTDPIPSASECTLPLVTTPAPKCSGSEMTYAISHTAISRDPVIYAYRPTSAAPTCTGATLSLSGIGGWTCVTVAARDQAGAEGNLGIAPPLRVCRKLAPSDCGGNAVGTILTPPADLTCTDGCTLPSVYYTPAMPRVLVQ